ncbi:MAG: hypothetical protein J07HQW2_00255, partial [Haloquadratum walsbyi J07HQW2]
VAVGLLEAHLTDGTEPDEPRCIAERPTP